MPSLTTVIKVKALMGWTDSTYDARITAYLPYADSLIQGYTGRLILQTTNTDEELNGEGYPILVPNDTPIISVSSLQLTDPISGSVLETITNYKIYDEYIRLVGSNNQAIFNKKWGVVFPIGEKNVKITYVSGWATVPGAVELAASLLIGQFIKNPPDGLESEKIGNYQYKRGKRKKNESDRGIPPGIAEMLDPFVRLFLEVSAQPFGVS